MHDQNDLPDRNPNFAEPVEVTEPWASAFREAGLVSPVTDEPSIQQLSKKSDVHPSAIARIISGRTRKPRAQTVDKIARALQVDFLVVASWIGQKWEVFEPWVPPATANLMTGHQRDIIESLIREFTNTDNKE